MSAVRVLTKAESIVLLHEDLTTCRSSLQTALLLLEKANRSIICWRDYASNLCDMFFESKAMMSSFWIEECELRVKADLCKTVTVPPIHLTESRRRDDSINSIVAAKLDKLMQVEREEYESEIKALQDALRELGAAVRRTPNSCRSTSTQTIRQAGSEERNIALALEMKQSMQETALEIRQEAVACYQEHCAATLLCREGELRRQRSEARVERYKLNQRIEVLEASVASLTTDYRDFSNWLETALSHQVEHALHYGQCAAFKCEVLCDAVVAAYGQGMRVQTALALDLQRRLEQEQLRNAARADAVLESSQLFAMVEEYEDCLTHIEERIAQMTEEDGDADNGLVESAALSTTRSKASLARKVLMPMPQSYLTR